MSTVRQIITAAYRQLGVVGGEGLQPNNYQFADALAVLQSSIRGLINGGAVGRMKDVTPIGDYVAGENERVYRIYDDAHQTITLPDLVGARQNVSFSYGRSGFDPNDVRPVRDGSFVSIVDSLSGNIADFLYDGQQKRWIAIYALAVDYDDSDDAKAQLTSVLAMDCPFSFGDAHGLAAYLAKRLSGAFGMKLPDTVAEASRNFLIALTHSYSTGRFC